MCSQVIALLQIEKEESTSTEQVVKNSYENSKLERSNYSNTPTRPVFREMAGQNAHGLMEALLSTNNDIRSQAEESYEVLPVEQKVSLLLGVISNHAEIPEEGRLLSAVMLRRLFSYEFDEFFGKLPEDQKTALKEQIIVCVQREPSKNVRRKCADLASEVARNLTDDEGNNLWPEFLKFLFDSASSSNPEMKEVALHMFTSIPSVLGNQEPRYCYIIKTMLAGCLDDDCYSVRFGAVKAACSYLTLHEDRDPQKHLGELLGPILTVTFQSIEKQEDDVCLKSLIDMAESIPKFLRPQLEQIFLLCLKVVWNTDILDSWRQLALELMVTTAETAPAMVRKVVGGSVGPLVQACLQMMTDLEAQRRRAALQAQKATRRRTVQVGGALDTCFI